MKFTFCLFMTFLSLALFSQTIWDGPVIRVEKESFADISLSENQDSLTQNVIITRGNSRGFFNIAQETAHDTLVSPVGTEWARGTIADGIGSLSFQSWRESHGGIPISVLGQDVVLHLIEDDIYIDFKLIEWTGGVGQGVPGGGGFIYERSTPNPLTSIAEIGDLSGVEIYPNPAHSILNLRILEERSGYMILELINGVGQLMERKLIDYTGRETIDQIDISSLEKGLYLVRMTIGEKVQTQKILIQ